jgi:hypothetical protein
MLGKTTTEIIKDFLFESFEQDSSPDLPPQSELDDFQFIKKNDYDALVFLNPKTEQLLELTNEYGHVSAYSSNFDEIVIKKIEENLFFCMNCWENDLEILKYKMNKYGIKNFKIEEVTENVKDRPATALLHDFKNEDVYKLTFKSNADCAAFQLYFQDYITGEAKSD